MKESPYDEIRNFLGVICCFWHHEFLMPRVKLTKESLICLLNWYFRSYMAFENIKFSLKLGNFQKIWSSLSGLRLNVSIFVWKYWAFSLIAELSDGFSLFIWFSDISLFVIELSRIGVCRSFSTDGKVLLKIENWHWFSLYSGFVKSHVAYYILPL